jgi:GTPase involved in cell partitioning and DNA repair
MPGWELIVGCVGKPSAGKSTLFNAVTDGQAKVDFFFISFPYISRLAIIHSQQSNQTQELHTI